MSKRRIKIIGFNLGLTFVLLLFLELGLRITGFEPGGKRISSFKFLEVDSLILTNEFIADSFGITKANFEYNWGKQFNINQDGFRGNSIEQVLKAPQAERLLLIGDSFTWGLSASPINQCYADLLDKSGFAVFNSGIPTVGPNQYAALANILVPEIKPQNVAVFFFIGNDLFEEKVPMKSHQVAYYKTNAGIFNAYINGRYEENYEVAYEYYKNKLKKKGNTRKIYAPVLNWCIKESVVCYMTYDAFRKLRTDEFKPKGKAYLDYLRDIKNVCEQNGCNFWLFVIPDYGKPIDPQLFEGFNPIMPGNLSDDDYVTEDGHFNNQGHRKFYEFVSKELKN